MLKKIICLLIMFALLIPQIAYADAAGDILDKDKKLVISAVLDDDEAEVDGEIGVELTLANTSSDYIDIRWIFIMGHEVSENKDFDTRIEAGKKTTIKMSVEIDDTIQWYKEDEEYYVNLDVEIIFYTYWEETEDYWYYTNLPIEPIPIRLTNVIDGSEIVQLKISELEDKINFCHQYYGEGSDLRGKYHGEITNAVEIMNAGEEEISNYYLRPYARGEKQSIEANSSIIYDDVTSTYYYEPDKIPDELSACYSMLFLYDGQYYAVEEVRKYPTKVMPVPELDISVEKMDDGYSVNVQNLSHTDYHGLFIHFERAWDYDYFDFIPVYCIDTLKAKDSIEINVDEDSGIVDEESHDFVAGYYIGQYIYPREYWKSPNSGEIHSCNYAFETHRIKVPDKVLTTASPTAVVTPSPTKTVTATPQSTPEITPQPSDQPVSIESVTTEDIKPLWVWGALGAAIVGAIIMIFVIQRKARKNTDTET